MNIPNELQQKDLDVIFNCLKTSLREDIFEDSEYHTLMGLTKDEVKKFIDNWDKLNFTDENVSLAILTYELITFG